MPTQPVQAHLLTLMDPSDAAAVQGQQFAKLYSRIGEIERLPDLRSSPGLRP
ncbi:MAG: hypothetical protein U5K76_13790 [Woeseiaceae bacterium]|nr:hypothetical protein [Woeseiaceae bacterium]